MLQRVPGGSAHGLTSMASVRSSSRVATLAEPPVGRGDPTMLALALAGEEPQAAAAAAAAAGGSASMAGRREPFPCAAPRQEKVLS